MESDSLSSEEPYQRMLLAFLDFFDVFSVEVLVAIGLIVVLLVLSGLISGSEVAYFSMSPKDLLNLEQSDDKSDQTVATLLLKPRLLLATILVSNNFINVAIILVSNYIISVLFHFENLWSELLVNVVLVSIILVFFGEVSPKIFATQNKFKLAAFTSGFLKFIRFIFFPISWLLVKSGQFVESKIQTKAHEIDLNEIEKAIELSTTKGSTKEDVEMLKGIVHLGNTAVKQIMNPRMEIIGVEKSMSYAEVLLIVKEHGYSRMPIYRESIDNIEGILYIKDLLEFIDEKDDFDWTILSREATYVPETKKIDDLLREIQASRKHQVIVVDEYGGTSGLVTLEDILEEVVGDIKDEFDDELEQEFRRLNDTTYLMEGKLLISQLCKLLEIDSDTFDDVKGESDSIAGLLLELFAKIPSKGSSIQFKTYFFTVLALDRNRINKVKLTIKDEV